MKHFLFVIGALAISAVAMAAPPNKNIVCGNDVTITAVPENGHKFYQWSDGNTDNPRTFTVLQDSSMTAIFSDLYERKVTPLSWGTICLPWQSIGLEGGTFYEVAGKTATSIALVSVGELQAGYPYIFQSSEDTIRVEYLDESKADSEADPHTGIYGSFLGQDVPVGKYIIYNDKIYKAGQGCTIGANRAYLDLDVMPTYVPKAGVAARFLPIHGIATDIDETQGKSSDLSPEKMIINDQLIIYRNGRYYNAQGLRR